MITFDVALRNALTYACQCKVPRPRILDNYRQSKPTGADRPGANDNGKGRTMNTVTTQSRTTVPTVARHQYYLERCADALLGERFPSDDGRGDTVPAPSLMDGETDGYGSLPDLTIVVATALKQQGATYDDVAAMLESARPVATSELMQGPSIVRKLKATDPGTYISKALRYSEDPGAITVVDGTEQALGTYTLTTEDGKATEVPYIGASKRTEASRTNGSKGGRPTKQRSKAAERKAAYRARVREQQAALAAQREQAESLRQRARVQDRLATRW